MIKLRDAVSILIVEDDPGHARLLEIAIRRLGIGNPLVKIARGDEAMRYLGLKGHAPAVVQEEPPLVLLDLNLPGNSGFEVLQALRAEEVSRHPVIIMTSSDDANDRRRCEESGCDDYLIKPPEEDELVASLSRLGLIVV
jgi:DNA-binding response OmpR family regulator